MRSICSPNFCIGDVIIELCPSPLDRIWRRLQGPLFFCGFPLRDGRPLINVHLLVGALFRPIPRCTPSPPLCATTHGWSNGAPCATAVLFYNRPLVKRYFFCRKILSHNRLPVNRSSIAGRCTRRGPGVGAGGYPVLWDLPAGPAEGRHLPAERSQRVTTQPSSIYRQAMA